jgi:hypothetical protein
MDGASLMRALSTKLSESRTVVFLKTRPLFVFVAGMLICQAENGVTGLTPSDHE